MKKIWRVFAAVALVAFAATTMASCDKDDDNDKDLEGGASKIAGTYNGDLSATVMGTPCDFDGKYDVVITKLKGIEDDVTITLPECTYSNEQMHGGFVIPSVTVADVDVARSSSDANVYVLDDEDFSTTVDGMTVTGKISGGKVTGSKIELTYTITPGTMPMPINFTFTGNLK